MEASAHDGLIFLMFSFKLRSEDAMNAVALQLPDTASEVSVPILLVVTEESASAVASTALAAIFA